MPARTQTPRVIASQQSDQLMLPILDEFSGPRDTGSCDSPRATTGTCDPGRVTDLLETASREERIIKEITACLEELMEAQAAKRALSGLTAAEIRKAVESRHSAVADRPGLTASLGSNSSGGLPAGVPAGLADGLPNGLAVGLTTLREVSA